MLRILSEEPHACRLWPARQRLRTDRETHRSRAAAFDAATGTLLYRARVGGGGSTFSSSPWARDGRIFCLSEDGDTFVIAAGDAYHELGKNSLGEMSLASPAMAHDSLFIRTATRLYRIASKPQ